jgi:F0F1-type ATP synthase membrane subunit b/b'
MGTSVISAINLLILIGIMIWKLRAPITSHVADRHVLIRDEIQTVRVQLSQAQEKYEEFSSKLKAIDAEISVLREQNKQDTAALKMRVTGEARRVAAMVASDARDTAGSLFAELKGQLYLDWSLKVLDRTEEILRERLTSADRSRIREEFSKQLGAV